MIGLVRAELIKLKSQPFIYISFLIIIIATPLWAHLKIAYTESDVSLSSFLVFSYATQLGIKLTTFLILIISAMSFASEFDRGTIKIILTRPVTRTEVFTAKCISCIIISIIFVCAVHYVALIYSFLKGELHHVWSIKAEKGVYDVHLPYEQIMSRLLKSIAVSLLPIIATCFLGIFVSNITESAGYAVASGLIIFLIIDILEGLVRGNAKFYLLNYYQLVPFIQLGESASATGRWDIVIEKQIIHTYRFLLVPFCYSFILGFISYLRFRFKNIMA